MKYKKSIIMLVLVIFIFGAASVCASDVNDMVASENTGQMELSSNKEMAEDNLQIGEDNSELTLDADDEGVSTQSNMDILNVDSAAKYSNLSSEISKSGNIKLKYKNYVYDGGAAIEIKEADKVIDGNGAVIDMAGSNIRAFSVKASGVTIKNLTIKNVKNTDLGGAIYWMSTGGTVSDCTFINNTALNGGAIYWNFATGTVSDCTFIGNTAVLSGGAIWWNGWGGSVSGCTFIGNTANNGEGGAIYWNENGGSVSDCAFINNKGRNVQAIYSGNALSVDYCWFGNNATNYDGQLPINQFCNYSLFLNATANPDSLSVSDTSSIIFKLYLYNSSSGNITEYDNAPFKNLNFTITATNGFADKNSVKLGENVTFTATDIGICTLTASIENAQCTIELDNRADSMLSVPSQEAYFTQNATIALNYNSTATGKVNITLKGKNGNNYTFTDLDLNATLSLGAINVDEYDVNVTYSGDDNFVNATAEGTLKVIKANSTLTVNDITFDYNGTGFTEISFTGAVGVDASVIGHDEAVVTVTDSSITVSGLDAGNYTLTVTTIPDANHNPVTKTVNVTVNKIDSTLAVDNITFDYNGSGSGNVSFTGAIGVNASVFNQSEAAVNVTGNTITVYGLDAGNYTLAVTTMPDANHNPVTVNATITVNRLKTDLTASEITTTYNINKDLVITLKDANGNTLAGFNVTVDLNGVKTYTTDSKGQVKVSTKGLAPNTYTVKISFNGDANHVNSAADVKVTVNKATPKLTAKAKTFKSSVKTKKYTITLKDNTGKAIKKAKVTLKVKGKTYKATTNSKGKATFKITKLTKKGNYKATITFKGDKYYKKATKKSKIKVIVTFKTVSKGSKDKATVKEIQQALKDNGYYLTYKGHYLKIDGIYKGCTERSVKQFQKAKHLKVTGKVDEKTAKKLGII
ncbi:peptidoglycan-binding protein [Methanobrevibacter sp.]|uniref:peptidoglycan-binding protein n=1 Tax=Methanobrevibacter sp. TaxID=66852 RepID=UPI003866353D